MHIPYRPHPWGLYLICDTPVGYLVSPDDSSSVVTNVDYSSSSGKIYIGSTVNFANGCSPSVVEVDPSDGSMTVLDPELDPELSFGLVSADGTTGVNDYYIVIGANNCGGSTTYSRAYDLATKTKNEDVLGTGYDGYFLGENDNYVFFHRKEATGQFFSIRKSDWSGPFNIASPSGYIKADGFGATLSGSNILCQLNNSSTGRDALVARSNVAWGTVYEMSEDMEFMSNGLLHEGYVYWPVNLDAGGGRLLKTTTAGEEVELINAFSSAATEWSANNARHALTEVASKAAIVYVNNGTVYEFTSSSKTLDTCSYGTPSGWVALNQGGGSILVGDDLWVADNNVNYGAGNTLGIAQKAIY